MEAFHACLAGKDPVVQVPAPGRVAVEGEETGERFTYFAENSVVLSKLLYLITSAIDYKGIVFELFKTKSANTNEYWDIKEYGIATES